MSDSILTLRNVSFQYPSGIQAVHNLSLDLFSGDFAALIGSNGAGKTTVLKLLLGLLQPDRGDISLFGEDSRKLLISQIARKIGFVLQNPDLQLFAGSVEEEVQFGLKNLGMPKAERKHTVSRVLALVGLEGKLREHPLALSKGERAKLVLASVLAMDPQLIILDEPTNGQDYGEAIRILEIVKELNTLGKTVLMVSHNMNIVARYARKGFVLHEGGLLTEGPIRRVFSRTDLLSQAKISPPYITKLSQRLSSLLGQDSFLSPEELAKAIADTIKAREGAAYEHQK